MWLPSTPASKPSRELCSPVSLWLPSSVSSQPPRFPSSGSKCNISGPTTWPYFSALEVSFSLSTLTSSHLMASTLALFGAISSLWYQLYATESLRYSVSTSFAMAATTSPFSLISASLGLSLVSLLLSLSLSLSKSLTSSNKMILTLVI